MMVTTTSISTRLKPRRNDCVAGLPRCCRVHGDSTWNPHQLMLHPCQLPVDLSLSRLVRAKATSDDSFHFFSKACPECETDARRCVIRVMNPPASGCFKSGEIWGEILWTRTEPMRCGHTRKEKDPWF